MGAAQQRDIIALCSMLAQRDAGGVGRVVQAAVQTQQNEIK